MIIKILGVFDILIAIIFWMYGIFQLEFMSPMILILGFLLLIKGVSFSVLDLNWTSIGDGLVGIFMIFGSQLFLPGFIVIIGCIFLLQKGVLSLIS